MFGRWRNAAAILPAVAICALSVGCRASAEKKMMARLEGKWVWRQEGRSGATVVELELTSKGHYKRTSYREVEGKRKLLYIHPFTNDVVVEPDDPAEIEKLKKQRYKPSIDSGRYYLNLEETPQKITFESESLSRVEATEGMGVIERTFVLRTENTLLIGGRTYQRQPSAPRM